MADRGVYINAQRQKSRVDELEAENRRLRTENERVQQDASRMLREAEKRIPAPPSWSISWPTEPGWYWFYGSRSSEANTEPGIAELVFGYMADGAYYIYSTGGYHLRQNLGATGLWLPLETPKLPEEEIAP